MISLAQYNLAHSANGIGAPCRNGIACPRCSAELWDSSPMLSLTSFPSQKNVHCDACGFRGFRVDGPVRP